MQGEEASAEKRQYGKAFAARSARGVEGSVAWRESAVERSRGGGLELPVPHDRGGGSRRTYCGLGEGYSGAGMTSEGSGIRESGVGKEGRGRRSAREPGRCRLGGGTGCA